MANILADELNKLVDVAATTGGIVLKRVDEVNAASHGVAEELLSDEVKVSNAAAAEAHALFDDAMEAIRKVIALVDVGGPPAA